MAGESGLSAKYSIEINDYNPNAFCLIRVELDEKKEPVDFTFLYCNDALARLEGKSKDELIGKRFFDIFPDGNRKWLKYYYKAACEGETVSFDELSEEIHQYLHIEAYPVGQQGLCTCTLFDIKEDVYERRQGEERLKNALEQEKLKTEIITSIAATCKEIVMLDCEKQEYYVLSGQKGGYHSTGTKGSFDELREKLLMLSLSEEDRERPDIKAFFDFGTVQARLEETNIVSQEVKSVSGLWHLVSIIADRRDEDGRVAYALFVVRDIAEQKQKEKELIEAEQKRLQTINAIGRAYSSIYVAYLDTHEIEVIKGPKTGYNTQKMGALSMEQKREYTRKYVAEPYCEGAMEFIDLDTVARRLEGQESLTYTFLRTDGTWMQYLIAPQRFDSNGKVDMILLANRDVTEEKNKELKQQEILKNQLGIIDSLANEYSTLYLIDAETKNWRVFKRSNIDIVKNLVNDLSVYQDYEVAIAKYIETYVAEEYRAEVTKRTKLENLLAEAPDKGVYSLYFDRILGEERQHWQINTAKFTTDAGKTYVVMGFRDIHAAVEKQVEQQKRLEEALSVARHEKEKLEEAQERLRESMAITSALSRDYSNVFLVQLKKNLARTIKTESYNVREIKGSDAWFDYSVIIRKYIEDRVYKPDVEMMLEETRLDRALKKIEEHEDFSIPFRILSDGELHYLQMRYVSIEGADLVAVGFRYVDDVVKKEAEQKELLQAALATAQQANRAKTTFLNSMSHDIRTPMNAIIGFTALAQTHIDEQDKVQDYLGKISTSSTHLLSLINDILDMSRIESGTVKLDEKTVHIPDLLHDLRTMIQSLVNSKSLNLFIDTQDVVHEDVLTDKLRLNQVLLNIVSNAIKFTQPGGDIIIRLVEKPCTLKHYTTYEFTVKDNGIGMSKEFLGHIFETFTREYSATVSGIQGTGLGMAITKNIVDMMGGEITVESEEGKGSLFTVTLNLRLANEPAKNEPIPALLGAKALIVDDDMNTCRSVSKMLRDIEMRPDWTTSGKEAVVRAQDAAEMKDEYKVYIIDYLMPDMNGIETVRRIRKVISEDVPIIVLTAYDWADFEHEAREAGVTAFVSKPIFMSELRAVLTQPAVTDSVEKERLKERTYDYSGKRILLAEDNELNREIATAILEETGMSIDTVTDGDEAVAAISNAPADKYDLVLMDIQMPKMDGYIATKEIRTLADNRKANIPIVAMTANAFDEDRKKAFEAGMNGHIIKPISIGEIAKVLDEIFAGKK